VGVVCGLLVVLGLLLFGQWGYDDPFITYRYASNLLAGNGFVYNVGQRTLSTTAPLYAVLLAGLGLIWPDLPSLSNAVSAVSLVLSAGLLFAWSQAHGERAVGAIAALLLIASPLMLMTFGAETCTYVMLILAGLYAYDRSRLLASAVLLAAATAVRPDAIVAVVALGIYQLVRRRSIPWRPVLLYAALVGIWYAGLWLYFGSPIPVTLLAKQQQGQMAISTRFHVGLLELVQDYGREPLYWLHGALALVGLGWVVTRGRYWLPLILWVGLYILAYSLLGVSRYFWYYAPLMPAFVVSVAAGMVALVRLLGRWRASHWLMAGATTVLVVLLLVPVLKGALWVIPTSDARLDVYTEIGQWLNANTPPEASVGALEVGIIGYYARRPIVDFAGLIQPDVARRLQAENTYQESADWAVQIYQPQYVVLHSEAFAGLTESDWFQEAYLPVREFANEREQALTVYRRSRSP
jgi:hypothetical protein